jgi:hypothetical protein
MPRDAPPLAEVFRGVTLRQGLLAVLIVFALICLGSAILEVPCGVATR